MISTATLRTRNAAISTFSGAVVAIALGASLLAPATAQAAGRSAGECTVTKSGSVAGTQTVAAGEKLCLRQATVGGAITVEPGGALDVKSSIVQGAITSSAGESFSFCGSETVVGAISVSGTTGTVRIGDNEQCGGNAIDGEVTVNSSTRAVKIARNTVNGAMTVASNASRGGANPIVSGNEITGDLSCSANTPKPTDRGRENLVSGLATGQCAPGF